MVKIIYIYSDSDLEDNENVTAYNNEKDKKWVKNEKKWIKNIRKIKRLSGKAYLTEKFVTDENL